MDPSRRMGERLARRLLFGGLTGAVIGFLLAAVVGVVEFGLGTTASTMCMVGGGVFGALIGALVGGYSGLESPTPGQEPSEVERPVLDRSGLTDDERDVPAIGDPRADDQDDGGTPLRWLHG